MIQRKPRRWDRPLVEKKHGYEANTHFGKLKPERGVIEVKPFDKDLSALETSDLATHRQNGGRLRLPK